MCTLQTKKNGCISFFFFVRHRIPKNTMSIAIDINTSVFGYLDGGGGGNQTSNDIVHPQQQQFSTPSHLPILLYNTVLHDELCSTKKKILRFPQEQMYQTQQKLHYTGTMSQDYISMLEISSKYNITCSSIYFNNICDSWFSNFMTEKHNGTAFQFLRTLNTNQKYGVLFFTFNLDGNGKCGDARQIIKMIQSDMETNGGLCIIKLDTDVIDYELSKILFQMLQHVSSIEIFKPSLSHPVETVKYIILKRNDPPKKVRTDTTDKSISEGFRMYIYNQNNRLLYTELQHMKRFEKALVFGCTPSVPIVEQQQTKLFIQHHLRNTVQTTIPSSPTCIQIPSSHPQSPIYVPSCHPQSPIYVPSNHSQSPIYVPDNQYNINKK